MITAKEYAEIHNVHYTTVMNWLRRDLVPGAVKEDLQKAAGAGSQADAKPTAAKRTMKTAAKKAKKATKKGRAK